VNQRAHCTRRREAGIVPRLRTRIVDRAFSLALAIKGIDGALELIGGLLLFVVPPSAITLVFRSLTQHELSEDPYDFVAIHVRAAAEQSAGTASVRGFGVPGASDPLPPRQASAATLSASLIGPRYSLNPSGDCCTRKWSRSKLSFGE
jgi:hypothetical protein